ncbi:MAG TPA: trypsin-like peptidase domain-containing protein [Roseateles sp.]
MHSRHRVRALLLACALLSGVMLAAATDTARTPRQALPSSFAPAYERGASWSVGVYVFMPGEDDPRVGGGFFVDDQGGIATAAHLLGAAQQILIALPDRRVLAAALEGRDDASDIALLRISPPLHMQPVFGHADQLRVGDWVMAVGEPFGLEHSVSVGVVSGKDRHFGDDGELLFIQSDVALNPGNSGGPLLDASGAIVGMNARTIVGPIGTPGASLAIPIDIVRQIVAELRSDGPGRERPLLGAQFDDVPPLTAWTRGRRETTGSIILSVPRGSVAEQLRLRAGDIVTMMNGRPIRGSADLVTALLAWRKLPGTRIVVQRAGEQVLLKPE